MQFNFPYPPIYLTCILVASYLGAIWWLLRLESWRHLLGLFMLSLISLGLRLFDIHDLPPGLNDDEVKSLLQALPAIETGAIFPLGVEGPILHTVLFQVPMVDYTGSLFWGSRIYPLILGSLSAPLAFAIGRALQFSPLPSYVLAFLVAVLPWSVFWSRLPWGGEIIFYQCLLVASLARIIWRQGGLIDVLVGILGMSGLFWEYTGAWSMVGMPLVAVVLAPGLRRRLYAFLVLLGGVILWIPYILHFRSWIPYVTEKASAPTNTSRSLSQVYDHYAPLVMKSIATLWSPTGNTSWISMHSVAIHPEVVLLVALLGLVSVAPTKSLFNLGGFAAGILTASVSFQGAPSTHRMMCAFLFISISSAGFFQLVARTFAHMRIRLLPVVLATAFLAVAMYQSLAIFYAPRFWTQSEGVFFHGETLLAEALQLSPSSSTILDGDMVRYAMAGNKDPRSYRQLSYKNWIPKAAGQLAISRAFEEFIPFYREALGSSQVELFGGPTHPKAALISFGASDIPRWGQHGWRLFIECKDASETQSLHVPALAFDRRLNDVGLGCNQTPYKYRYVARWQGPAKELALAHDEGIVSTIDAQIFERNGRTSQFKVNPGDVVSISLIVHNAQSWARLYETSDDGQRIPTLESFVPLPE